MPKNYICNLNLFLVLLSSDKLITDKISENIDKKEEFLENM